ncbi:MAG: hypothetical protein ACOZNI_10580 [Myxococcota bacterium]
MVRILWMVVFNSGLPRGVRRPSACSVAAMLVTPSPASAIRNIRWTSGAHCGSGSRVMRGAPSLGPVRFLR